MSSVKHALSTAGLVCLGVLAAFGIYLVCVVATFFAGGWVYSVTLGAMVAPVVAGAILVYRWTWRRLTTPWPLVAAMVVTQLVLASLAFLDGLSTARMWFH